MSTNAIHRRLARLQSECDVSVAPAILLCVACSVLVLYLGLNAPMDETIPAQAGELTPQTTPCAG